MSLDKHTTKTGKYVVSSTTGWYIFWERAGLPGGSAGHGHCNCSAGATTAAAQDNLRLKLPPSASKSKPANKLEEEILTQYLFPIFPNPPVYYFVLFLYWSSCSSSCCPVGVISFVAALRYYSLLYYPATYFV